jgi:hypothetical protein
MVLRFKIIIIFCIFSVLQLIGQTNIYVATTGNDITGTGSITSPYATITKAATVCSAGDSVFVRAGTYRNSDYTGTNSHIWSGEDAVTISANGSAGNYIVFTPYQNEKVLIEFDGAYGVLIKNASYITFKGFEIKGIADKISITEAAANWGIYRVGTSTTNRDLAVEMGGISFSDKVNDKTTNNVLRGMDKGKPIIANTVKPEYYNGRALVANSSHYINLENNIIRDVPSAAIRAQQCDYVNIIGNEVFRCTYWSSLGVGAITVAEATSIDANTNVKIVIARNRVYENENRLVSWNPSKDFVHFGIDEGTGIFLTRNNATYLNGKMLIANNISYKNGASGIVCHFTDRTIIEHNTVYDNGTTNDGEPGGIGINQADDVTVRNNIAYSKSNRWALGKVGGTLTNINLSSNIIFNNNGSVNVVKNDREDNFIAGFTKTNPLFVDAMNHNFNLQGTSPAINTGNTSGTQTVDFFNVARNEGVVDVGAIEYLPVKLSIKVFLEGCFNTTTGKMQDALRANNLLTNKEPYTGLGFSHVGSGGETVLPTRFTTTGGNAIVDWVFVELRNATTPSVIAASRLAFIQADGDIVYLDGVSPLSFKSSMLGSYLIVVKHRNHLKVKTNTAIALTNGNNVVNLSIGGASPMKSITIGANIVYMMYAGDLNQDGTINTTDRSNAWNARNISGYNQNDCSLNGTVDATDRSNTWNNRNINSDF